MVGGGAIVVRTILRLRCHGRAETTLVATRPLRRIGIRLEFLHHLRPDDGSWWDHADD